MIKQEATVKKGELQIGEKEKSKTMNSVFSADDFSDCSWAAPDSNAAAGMSRSHSEWALERFLEEFSGAGETVIGPSSAAPQPSVSKAEEGDAVVEIKNPNNQNHNPPPSDPTPTVSIDSDEFRSILKSKLELECAAVALSRPLAVKAEDSSAQAENRALQSGSKVQASSKVQGQGEAGVTSCGVLVESTTHKKSGVQVRQATSGSSREDSDSDDLEGDTETTETMDAADAKRARRMRSNRESARRSRRRKQVQMNEFEGQVGQLRVEHSTLLNRLTEMNHKYDEAAVDNRIMKADIETLRAKVKMAEETVKRVTGINPGLLSRPNIPSVGMPFLSSPLEASTIAPLPMQSNANRFFHPVPSIVAPMHHNGVDNCFVGKTLVPPDMTSHTKVGLKNVTETSTSKRGPSLEGGHDQIGLGFHARGPMPGWEPGHAADRNHKQS